MKCPKCNKNHKYSAGMTCSCGYHFVFNPKEDKLTDGKFAAAIVQASRNGTYFFTPNQLYTAFCRRQKQKTGCLIVMLATALIAIIGGMAAGFPPLVIPAIFIALVSGALLAGGAANPNLKRNKFDALLLRWTGLNKVPQLIDRPAMHQPPPDWPEPDIYNYGAERILVVQHDLLVDALVRNNFHAEQSCIVVSVNHYPQYIWQRAEKIIEAGNPTAVFLLHDASVQGMRAAERFKAEHATLLRLARVLDLGLFPGDAEKIEPLRALNLKKDAQSIPVDAIPYAHLQGLIAQSMEKEVAMHTILITAPAGGDYSSDSGGSYG